MEIIKSEYLGFCEGVDRAIKIAEESAKKFGKVFTLGDIIHNKIVVDMLEEKGVKKIADNSLLKPGDTAIIRSHGIAKEEEEELRARGITIIDATCPYVKKIHREVEKQSDLGYEILILGDKNHSEVKGTLGYAKSATVFESADEIDFLKNDKFFLVVQTTYSEELADKIIAEVEKKAKIYNKSVVILHSICYTTNKRQLEAQRISKLCDTVFVIGDRQSANTKKLYEIAKVYASDVRFIEKVSDVTSVLISKKGKLGIISGASAPKELIMEVLNNMVEESSKMDGVLESASTAQPAVKTATTEAEKEPTTMAEALKNMKAPRNYRPGHKLTVHVAQAEQTGISVVILESTSKSDSGFIDKDEVELEGIYESANYPAGTELQVVVIEGKQKGVNLSKKAFDAIKVDDEKVKNILAGDEFKLKILSETKGGLLGKIGSYTVFVPASQIRMGFVKELAQYVGKELRLKALPPKAEEVKEGEKPRTPNPKRIVASQRVILEDEKADKENSFWDIMEVNNIMIGKVKRFTPFGAFVSINGFDCLAHISDLAWHKIADPSEVLEINKSYDFVVLKVNRDEGKVSLGYKQLQKKPYELAAEKYPIGTIIKGKVQRIFNFGAFIEIEPGIDGLVHVSQIGHKWIQNAAEALKVDDEVEAKIIGFENNKITLSIKELLPEEAMPAMDLDSETGSAEKPNRSSKFQKRMEGADKGERKERRPRRQDTESDEPREWVSTEGGATMADLFKGLNMDDFQ